MLSIALEAGLVMLAHVHPQDGAGGKGDGGRMTSRLTTIELDVLYSNEDVLYIGSSRVVWYSYAGMHPRQQNSYTRSRPRTL